MSQVKLIFEKQWLHAFSLVLLLAVMVLVTGYDGLRAGQLWGVTTPVWLWLAVGIAIAHQIYVWLCWRTQLHASKLTRTLGSFGFPLYAVGFSILGI
jgi:membrane protein YdbS with pleckstrin-like domain